MYAAGPASRPSSTATATSATRRSPSSWSTAQWGATMVLTEPDAGSDVGAGRTKATLNDDGSWHIEGVKRFITSAEHDMSENIIHLVLARPVGVEGVGGPGTKGLSPVPRPEVPLRPRDRRADRRAQRRLRHQRRAQDGHQGLQHLRGHLRRPEWGGEPAKGWLLGEVHDGIAPDVPGHRERPHDGRHQGHRDAVDRLPQRAGVRQGARAGRRPHPGRRQDRAAGHDHPPPRRTPLADDAEVVRRGACARWCSTPRRWQDQVMLAEHDGETRRARRARSTTCCCRS